MSSGRKPHTGRQFSASVPVASHTAVGRAPKYRTKGARAIDAEKPLPEMATLKVLQTPMFALPGCQRISVNSLLCDTLRLAEQWGRIFPHTKKNHNHRKKNHNRLQFSMTHKNHKHSGGEKLLGPNNRCDFSPYVRTSQRNHDPWCNHVTANRLQQG